MKYKVAVIVVAAALLAGGAWWYVSSNAAPSFRSLTVGKGNIVESVNAPASVMTEHSVALSFQEGGQIASVDVHEGSVVAQGQAVAALDTASLQASVQEADAAVAAAQAKLDALTSGTRPQQLQIDANAVASASTSLGIAVSNAYTASNDAILNQTDNLFANPKTNNPTFLVPTANSQTLNDLSASRVQIGTDLASWYATLSSSSTDPASLVGTANHVLQEIHAYLNTIALAVNGAPAAAGLTPSLLASYKAYVSVATAEIASSMNAVSGAQAALTQAQGALTLAQAGSTFQDIEAQKAVVAQAEAADAAARVTLANATLVAPFAGTVQGLNAQVGQVVSPGAPLMTLVNQSGLKIETYVSQTDVAKIAAAAQAKLDALTSGTRPQQLQIDANAVASASTSLGIAVSNAYTASNDAILNQTDNLFANPKTNNPTFLVPTANSQTLNDLSASRVQIGTDLASWYATLSSSSTDPASLVGTANHVLQEIHAYLNTIALAVNGAPAAAGLTPSLLASYKAYVSVATAEIASSMNAVSGAQAALTQAQGALTLAQAGSTFQDIEAQKAVVAQAEAADAAARVTLANATLVAPFAGTVQGLNAQVGQVVSPGAPLMTLVNQSGLKIETYVSQTDVAKIAVGDKADVTLDAYGAGTVFPAMVTAVDPGETQVNGTAAYLVTLHFTGADARVKDGMTGNVRIIVAAHDNVVEVPSNLVITNNTSSFVLVPSGGTEVMHPVTTGLIGDNGMTEIVSGLSAGERIINF